MKQRLFRGGLVVAGRQFVAVLILGLCTVWLLHTGQINSHSDPPHVSSTSSDQIVIGLLLATTIAFADLAIAIGFVATSDAAIESTASAVQRVAHGSMRRDPWWRTERFILLTEMAAIVCALQALSAPPASITVFATSSSFPSVLLLVAWPGLFSVGFAFFAAIARAAIKSERSS